MKVVVKENSIIALHTDDQNVFYENSYIRIIPDDFSYDVPINKYDLFSRSYVPQTRLSTGDPDPLYNKANLSLQKRQLILYMTLSKECENFIYYKSDGDTRYPQYKQTSFTDIMIFSKEWLKDNPDASPELSQKYQDRITAIESVRDWIKTVLDYYYNVLNISRSLTDSNWNQLSWDFSQFEATDPDVWLENVRL